MDLSDVRKLLSAWPEVTEAPHFERLSFRAAGKIFATAPEDGEHLHIFVDEEATRSAISADPESFEELWWGKRLAGVRARLAGADGDLIEALLEEAWRLKAPKGLAASGPGCGSGPSDTGR